MVLSLMHADGCVKSCTWCSKPCQATLHTTRLLLLSWLLQVSIHVPTHTALCTSYELQAYCMRASARLEMWSCSQSGTGRLAESYKVYSS